MSFNQWVYLHPPLPQSILLHQELSNQIKLHSRIKQRLGAYKSKNDPAECHPGLVPAIRGLSAAEHPAGDQEHHALVGELEGLPGGGEEGARVGQEEEVEEGGGLEEVELQEGDLCEEEGAQAKD